MFRYCASAAVTMDDASVLLLAISAFNTEFSEVGISAVIFGIYFLFRLIQVHVRKLEKGLLTDVFNGLADFDRFLRKSEPVSA